MSTDRRLNKVFNNNSSHLKHRHHKNNRLDNNPRKHQTTPAYTDDEIMQAIERKNNLTNIKIDKNSLPDNDNFNTYLNVTSKNTGESQAVRLNYCVNIGNDPDSFLCVDKDGWAIQAYIKMLSEILDYYITLTGSIPATSQQLVDSSRCGVSGNDFLFPLSVLTDGDVTNATQAFLDQATAGCKNFPSSPP